jgi:hypothetical protein
MRVKMNSEQLFAERGKLDLTRSAKRGVETNEKISLLFKKLRMV